MLTKKGECIGGEPVTLKRQQPACIVVAVSTAAPATCYERAEVGVKVVCVLKPEPFYGVGFWYERSSQLSDVEVHDLLERARYEQSTTSGKGP
jgi:putative phosphoribosyl transferase